jgi:hydrogenase-4 component E
VNSAVVWILVALGLATVVVRRRSAANLLVTVQSLALGAAAFAMAGGRSTGFWVASAALVAKGLVLGGVLGWTMLRTREPRPIAEGIPAPIRFVVAVVLALGAAALIPTFGIAESAGNATVALVAIGAAVVLLRRSTIFQALGLVIAENGIAIAAASAHRGLPIVIELGFVFDVIVVVAVAVAVHERIHGEFGSGNTGLLRELRD